MMQDSFSDRAVYLGRTLLIAGLAIVAAIFASVL